VAVTGRRNLFSASRRRSSNHVVVVVLRVCMSASSSGNQLVNDSFLIDLACLNKTIESVS
jgi:hypothetical protein